MNQERLDLCQGGHTRHCAFTGTAHGSGRDGELQDLHGTLALQEGVNKRGTEDIACPGRVDGVHGQSRHVMELVAIEQL